MGVKGLWKLLLPIGRRISIETLAGKTLAIDASIWLTQFLKAMRDPETGKLVRSAHLIGFFRRICRLKFHRIRPVGSSNDGGDSVGTNPPTCAFVIMLRNRIAHLFHFQVFVFDGATPEIKRAEVLRRKRKRDTFADSLDKSAMQRLAKKLLADRLRKVKAQQSGNAITTNEGGFEAGFNPGGSQWKSDETQATTTVRAEDSNNSAGVVLQENEIGLLDDDDDGDDGNNEAPKQQISDWDLPISSELENNPDAKKEAANTQLATFSAENGSLAVDLVSSMASESERKDAVEQARKSQRMLSRQEFMPAAANPEDFSSVQMRNFLKYCKLNKDIASMAKKVADRRSHGNGFTAKSITSSVEFIQHQETDSEHELDETESVASDSSGPAPLLKKRIERKRMESLGSFRRLSNAKNDDSSEAISWDSADESQLRTKAAKRAIFDSSDEEDAKDTYTRPTIRANQRKGVNEYAGVNPDGDLIHPPGGFLPSSKQDSQPTLPNDRQHIATTVPEGFVEHTVTGESSPPLSGGFLPSSLKPYHENQAADDSGPDLAHSSISNDFALAKLLQEEEDGTYANALNQETDSQHNAGESPRLEFTSLTTGTGVAICQVEDSESESEESVDDIDWEDGSAYDNPQHMSESHDIGSFKRVEKEDLGGSQQKLSQRDDESGNATWSDFREKPNQSQGTADALRQAETTASNLANWAGRAFRRALKEVHQPVELTSQANENEKLSEEFAVGNNSNTSDDEDKDAEHKQQESESKEPPRQEILKKLSEQGECCPALSIAHADQQRQPANRKKLVALRTLSEAGSSRLDAIDWSSIRKQQERDTDTISDEMLEESKLLLQLFGIPYVEAPAEAEAQCVAMEQLGIVDGVGKFPTFDSICLIFGSSQLQRTATHLFLEPGKVNIFFFARRFSLTH